MIPPRARQLAPCVGLLLLSLTPGCGAGPDHEAAAPHAPHHAAAPPAAQGGVEAQLAEVARVHGAAGPWAVAGYRMGQYALRTLGLAPQSFDLEVTHHSPQEVQFSCIADGAAAATGASLGKLNLRMAEADEAHVETTYRRVSTGATLTLRPTASFRARFLNVPREELPAAGRIVMELPESEIFEVVSSPEAGKTGPMRPQES